MRWTAALLFAGAACAPAAPTAQPSRPTTNAAAAAVPAAADAVRAATAAWTEAINRDDLDAVVAGFAADGVFSGPEFTMRGADQIRTFFESQLRGIQAVRLTVATVREQGNEATATGDWELDLQGGGTDGGVYTATWARQPDGRWLLAQLVIRAGAGM